MAGDAPSQYAVTVPAEPDGLEHLHDLVDRARGEWPGVQSGDFDALEMAIIELAGNVAQHARPSGTTEMTLTLAISDAVLHAVLIDVGRRFEVDLDATELPDELDESGRGIVLARMTLDELDYDHTDGINTWRMTRRRR